MESFLNAMTIIGVVLVGLILVIGIALGIMLLAGAFNKHYEPLAGLKFNKTESQVILENEGIIYLTVTANTAEISESGMVLTDDTVDANIKLTVRNSKNVIDNSIIEVPSIVKKGVPFAVKAKLASDGFNQGGICYISAETSDMTYRVATPLEIKVDVPVDKISICGVDANTNKEISLESTKFIYNDEVQLSVNVEPKRALYVFGDQTKQKEIKYFSNDPDAVYVVDDASDGLIRIDYNPECNVVEPLEKPLATTTITAKIQKFSVPDPLYQKVVTQDVELGLYPLQLSQIIIRNEAYDDINDKLQTNLFSGNDLFVSAEDTGRQGVINLNIFLEPTIVKETSSADFNPMSNLLSKLQMSVEIKTNENYYIPSATNPTAVEIVEQEPVYYNDKPVRYWKIIPNRLLESGEEAFLTINLLDKAEQFAITRGISVNEVTTGVNGDKALTYKNSSDNEIRDLTLSIIKNSDNATEISGDSNKEITYSLNTSNNPTFKKVVTFVEKISSASSDTPINKNEVGSQIIYANKTTNQVDNQGENSFIVKPLGAGKVNIKAYLVRTDSGGKPIDKDYNIITTDEDLAKQDGYVLASGYCLAKNIKDANAGEYIVQQSLSEFPVTVSEKLTSLTFYTSSDFSDESKISISDGIVMGTTVANKVTIYAKPNSSLAIAENSSSQNVNVKISETEIDNLDKIFSDLYNGILTNNSSVYKYSDKEYSDSYARWFQFDLTTDKASAGTTSEKRSIKLAWTYNGDNERYSQFYVKTVNVPVGSIMIYDANDTTGDYKYDTYGVDTTENYLRMKLQPNISATESVKYAYPKANSDDKENRTYYRLSYVKSGSTNLAIPKYKSVVSSDYADNYLIKAPSSGNVITWLYLFKNDIISSTNPINITGITSITSLTNAMKLLYSTDNANITEEVKKNLWQEIAKRMDNAGSNNASDYVTLENSVLYVKKELPKDTSMYLFYSSGLKGNYQTKFGDFMPIAIHIDYSWPTFTGQAKLSDGTTATSYNILGDSTVSFAMDSFDTVQCEFYNKTGKNTLTLDAIRSITMPSASYIQMNLGSTDGKALINFSLTDIGKKLDTSQTTTVSVKRTVYFVIMSDDSWTKLKGDADNNNGFITDDAFNDTLSSASFEYTLSEELQFNITASN